MDPNYLSDPSDLDRLIRCFEVGREIAASPAFKALGAFEVYPGPDVKGRDQLEQFMRSNADSYWHFAGSCKMGTDRLSVVDPHLRVRGVEGLRVADGSVMPALPSGNCHAGIVMIAERAADFAKQTALGGKQAALAGA